MKITPKSRSYLRLQNVLFVLLLLTVMGMLAWLSTRYVYQADWTAGALNTLSPASQMLLKKLEGPVVITAYARETELLRSAIRELVSRYQRYKPDLRLSFVNPDSEPERVRELGITVEGEMLISYAGRSERLTTLNEQSLTNALLRVARADKHWLVFLQGHGERGAHGQANHDLGIWTGQLQSKGFNVQSLNLASTMFIPDNTGVLVIAGPQAELLPGKVELIQAYLDKGGNLLWLADPGPLYGLQPIAEQLGIAFQPGVIHDPSAQLFDIGRPGFTVVAEYPMHPITHGFDIVTLFPQARGIELQAPADWQQDAFLVTLPNSWVEIGNMQEGGFKEGGVSGPLNIGVALTRPSPPTFKVDAEGGNQTQRVVITGDGDFLSNAYLGNGGNLDLGIDIVNWLSHDDSFIAIGTKTALDTQLNLSRVDSMLIGFGFLFFLPLALLSAGLTIWLRRRRR